MKNFFIFALCACACLMCSKPKPHTLPPVQVTAFQVEPQTIPADFTFVGVAKSSHPVEIRARVEGYLLTIDYTEGSLVEPNQLLFRLDPRPFIASLDAAKGELARQEAVLWRAKKSLERIEPLYKQNAASLRDLDDATAAVLTAEASVMIAKANVVQAELNLSYTYITSPIKGLTGRALFREGTLITPSINGLLTYVSIVDPIWVYFSVSDHDLLQMRGERESLHIPETQEYTVFLTLSNGTKFPYPGKVNFASPTLDPQTGTMTVRASFPNPEEDIFPGQFVRATVTGILRPNAIFVPQQSVLQGKNGMFVFVISQDNKVSVRHIEVGDWYGEYWVIKKGLTAGDIVVVEGVNKIQDDAAVHVLSVDKLSVQQPSGENT
ncbi:MAG: efflux RND transporter periplasmic adaptor subunit [Verrucomicrobia bacterium]|nr:efflux RND transporter periplasmic adaptor subunit [Verrucomicrobiota bacterium]MBS0645629.1 efflux RND transporter periplasmic adaptor subunit [Verrucomicrobiota bacterium]